MAKHVTNEKSVLDKIDAMDEMDGTVYDTTPADDDNAEDDNDEGEEENTDGNNDEDGGTTDDVAGKRDTNDVTADTKKDTGTKEAAPDPSTYRKQGTNYVDAKNNIVDPQSGQIIAKAGTERRLFEKTQRLSSALDERSAKLTKYEQEDKTLDNLRGVVKNHGMSTDEFAEGINMVLSFKSDPVGTAKKILESVLAMGHNVTDILGADAGNAIEMSAVSKMLDERLKPLTAPLEQQRVSTEQQKQAEKQWEHFCEINDYANVHENTLDKMLGDNPGMTPQKAYNALREFAYKHSLDFSLPLGPQIEKLQSAPKKNNRDNNPARTQKPFPNGSSVRHAAIDDGTIDPNADWNSILRSAGLGSN